MNLPADLHYAESHEWLKVEGSTGTIGITDHAQHELSDCVYVELPKLKTVAKAKGSVAVVESVKAASDIYSPVSGEIIEVNEALQGDPSLINKDPYGQGWIYKIQIKDASEIKNLKDASAYLKQIGK